jgi:hypothetical protein
MSWEAIGAVGGIVGAVAVVVSVIYLATQIRSQTIESRLAATRDLSARRGEALKQLSGDDELIKIWLKAIRGYDMLKGVERMKASLLFHMIMRTAEQEFIHKGTGHVDDPYLESVDRVLSENVASPGVQQWWGTTKHLFNSGFQRHVDHLMDTTDRNPLNDAFVEEPGK